MPRTMAALIFLVGLLGCSTAVVGWRLLVIQARSSSNPALLAVKVRTEPPGALLVSADGTREFGKSPVTMTYPLPLAWESCLSFKGVQAKWSDGSHVIAQRLELCPDGGRDQVVVIAQPAAAPEVGKSRRASN